MTAITDGKTAARVKFYIAKERDERDGGARRAISHGDHSRLGQSAFMTSGLIFDIQRFSVHDGPGIRTTVFFKGCPASCWWCHNPESQSRRPQVLVLEGRCLDCGTCIEACPHGVLGENGGDGLEPRPVCQLCGTCVEACPSGARRMAGTRVTVREVLEEIVKDRLFFDDSGGGATFSGGEPLLQFMFLRAVLEACRVRGIHTAVDTCGYAPRDHLMAIVPWTDLFLYDLKIMDHERHRTYTGVSNEPILRNLQALGRVHENIRIRVPVVPGFNDDLENMESTARFAASVAGVRQVSLLPYHATGRPKFDRLGREDCLGYVPPPSRERIERLAQCFRSFGLETKTGG